MSGCSPARELAAEKKRGPIAPKLVGLSGVLAQIARYALTSSAQTQLHARSHTISAGSVAYARGTSPSSSTEGRCLRSTSISLCQWSSKFHCALVAPALAALPNREETSASRPTPRIAKVIMLSRGSSSLPSFLSASAPFVGC